MNVSGELRLVRGALGWGMVATILASCVLFGARGRSAGISVLIACGLVLANVAVSALISAGAGRLSMTGSMMIALPSFAIRMSLIATVLTFLQGSSAIDAPVFALSFGAAILAVIILEARTWKRTPWLALAFDARPSDTEES